MRTKLMIVLAVIVMMTAIATVAFCGGPDTAPTGDSLKGVGPVDGVDGKASERWFEYKNVNDIVNIALSEMKFNGLIDDEDGFGPVLRAAKPAVPVFVDSLDKDYPDYYLLNFLSKSKVVAIAIVGVKDGKAEFKECHRFDPQLVFPPVSSDEAKSLALKAGKATAPGQAKLVFQFSAQCPGAVLPAWDLGGGVHVAQTGEVFTDFAPEPKLAN